MMIFRRSLLPVTVGALCFAFLSLSWAADAGAAMIKDEGARPFIFAATLEAQFEPQGEETACEAEITPATSFPETEWVGASTVECSPGTIDAVAESQHVTASVTGLAADTDYRFRFLWTTASGILEGTGGTFHTFGVEGFTFQDLGPNEEADSAAGSHPYELVTRITLAHGGAGTNLVAAAAVAKDLVAKLPPGLIGNPTAVPECAVQLAEEQKCPGSSQVGSIRVVGVEEHNFGPSAIYEVAPAPGEPARFAGQINLSTDAYIDSGIRTGEDYGINASSLNIATVSNPYEFEIRFWGVPADPRHDQSRYCGDIGPELVKGCSVPPGTPKKPFLRNPTRCGVPLSARVEADSYNLPEKFFGKDFPMPTITGCDQLQFHPTLEVKATTETAESPTGLHVDLHVPQSEDPNGLATPDLKDAVVKLPPGLTVNPSSANGLAGCPLIVGKEPPAGEVGIDLDEGKPANCPDAAKVGTVEVDTPLLDHPLPGSIYIAAPYANPFNSLLAIYIAVNDPVSGVVIKLAGDVEIGPGGQLTTSFDENPQLPFEDFKLNFFDGPRAALKTGPVCGEFSTTSSLTPWSAPESGPPATPSGGFTVSNQPGGGSCPTSADQQPNHPSFEAGSESPLAGAYAPFVLRLTREDGTQQFSSLTVTPPPGLLGKLAGIPYCSDAALAGATYKSGKEEQASSSCPSASEVGIVNVGAGAGPSPFYVQGHAYLAGPYKGAPLSLAIITPAVAGGAV